jgi:hypothetical protein
MQSLSSHLNNITLIHYCCAKYPNFGGVARFDYHVSLAFPYRKWFQGPTQKDQMLAFLKEETSKNTELKKRIIVITDNHLACDIPNDYFVILFHHGVVKNTIERTPGLERDVFYRQILEGQEKMFRFRDPSKTLILSCSKYCIDFFGMFDETSQHYSKFEKVILHHTSELNYVYNSEQKILRLKSSQKPKVLGNWNGNNKGAKMIGALKKALENEFEFVNLKTTPTSCVETHNREVEKIYNDSDIFLHLSVSEGFSYATLDAFTQNLLIVGTNVGLLYDLEKSEKECDKDVALVFDWKKIGDVDFVADRIREIWRNKDKYDGKSRKWFEENCSFEKWIYKFREVVFSFGEKVTIPVS